MPKLPAPNIVQMQAHLKHLFGEQMHGLVELAWTKIDEGAPLYAKLFGLDQLEDLAEKAAELNAQRANVYVGAALRKEDAARDVRASGSSFLSATAVWADIDEEGGTGRAVDAYKTRGVSPTCVVITGTQPHQRAQMWFKLEPPSADPTIVKEVLSGLCQVLGGDTAVVDVARLMRLGGSVNWAAKAGRVPELTQVLLFDRRASAYGIDMLRQIFPFAEAQAGTGDFFGADEKVLIEEARTPGKRHNAKLRLVAHWIGLGYTNASIILMGEGIGHDSEATRRKFAKMLADARRKWNRPDPAHPVEDEVGAARPFEPKLVGELDPAKVPARQWLLEGTLVRGHVAVRNAPGGTGKSILELQEAVALATGRPITGHAVCERVRVWVYNDEDDHNELDRRLLAVLQHFKIPFSEIKERLALNSGDDRPLLVATATRSGGVIRMPDVNACIEQIRRHNFGYFSVDPYVSVHHCSENSNEQMNKVVGMFKEIARRTNCAVRLVHHSSKPAQGNADGHVGNANSARGASAIINLARFCETLATMSQHDCTATGIPPEQRHLYARLDMSKVNLALNPGKARWFKRCSVEIPNGDKVGVLESIDLKQAADEAQRHQDLHYQHIIRCLLELIPEPEIGLHAAAERLAWSTKTEFHEYQDANNRSRKRTTKPFNDKVKEACDRGPVILDNGKRAGFTAIEGTRAAVTLKRFEIE